MNNNTFLTQVLSSPDFHIPIEANFVVEIYGIQSIIQNLLKNKDLIADNNLEIYPEVWSNLAENDIFFANGVKLPGDGSDSTRVGVSDATVSGGLLSGPILTGRKSLVNFEISFLETNQSFIDFVIRPWIVAVSQFGIFARDPKSAEGQQQNFRTNVVISFLDKSQDSTLQAVRKQVTFYNAAPINVDGYDAAYGNGKNIMRVAATTWLYSRYKVSSQINDSRNSDKKIIRISSPLPM